MHSVFHQIHPRYLYNLSEGTSGVGESVKGASGVITEDAKKKEELQKFSKALLEDLLKSNTRKEAEEYLNNAEEGLFYEKDLGPEYDAKITLLRYWMSDSDSVFNKNGDKQEEIAISSIKYIENLLEIPQDKSKSIIEFLKEHTLSNHVNGIMEILGSKTLVTPEQKTKALYTKLEELKQQKILGNTGVEGYIKSIQIALKIPEFIEKNPGLREEAKNYPNGSVFLRSMLIEIATSESPISNIDLQKEYEKWHKLPEDTKHILDNYNPEFLYGVILEHVKELAANNKLSRKNVQEYINELRGIIQWRLQDQPDSLLSKTYEHKFLQMEAIAANPILDDDGFERLWKDLTGQQSLDAFLEESKKGEFEPGAVGKKDGKFHFYPKWEMMRYIMKKGEVEEGVEVAWKTYVESLNGNYGKLSDVFGGENMEAFSIYIRLHPDSNIFAGNEKMKQGILESLGNSLHDNLDGNVGSPLSAFPSLKKMLSENAGKYNNIEKIPVDENGGVDMPMLIMRLIKGKNITPDGINELKMMIVRDSVQSMSIAKEDADRSRHRLRELIKGEGLHVETSKKDDENFYWSDVIKELGGRVDLVTLVLNKKVKEDLSPPEAKVLKEYLEKIEKNTQDDVRKKEIITHVKNILEKEGIVTELRIGQEQVQNMNPDEISRIAESDDASKKYSDALRKNAKSQILRDRYETGIRENIKSIPRKLFDDYNLPSEAEDLMKIENYNRVTSAIQELKGKKEKNRDEQLLLATLESIVAKRTMEVEAYKSVKVFEEGHPEFSKSVQQIRENTDFLKNMTEKEKAGYEYMAIYMNGTTGTLEQRIGQLPPGSTVNLGKYLTEGSGEIHTSSFSLPIAECVVTKTANNTCSLSFPSGTGIGRVDGVPIVGIQSFISQAEIYARGSLQELIPLIPEMNRLISKQSGKTTSSFDGELDVFEVKRTLGAIAGMLNIDFDTSRGIDALQSSILTKYPSKSDIQSHLRRIGVLRDDGSFSRDGLEKGLHKTV